ncbi:MAG TPA: alpha/beta hydrolase [Thermoanaerobaculia bacterium]|nr:alpha/beta hydrolase [Thermoanaerobaculia bacterium]
MSQKVFWGLVMLLGLAVWRDAGVAQASERDLAYGPDPKQRLDLSVPAAKGFSTVLFIHGGSLTSGDKADEDYRDVCAPFPSAGIACASLNYRLAPAHAWPAQAEDVVAAVAWVRANIGLRGGDPRKLFLVGHSSGATLVALAGTDERYLARHGLKTSDLRGVVPMGSIMWDDELEQALTRYGRGRVEEAFRRDPDNRMYASLDAYLDHWPIRHARAGLPPFLFLIAESEQEQPPVLKTNRKFVADARALGNWAEHKVLPGRTHYSAIRNLSKPGDPVFAIVRDFVRKFSGVGPR